MSTTNISETIRRYELLPEQGEPQMEIATIPHEAIWTHAEVNRFYNEAYDLLVEGGLEEEEARFLAVQFSPTPTR